MSLFKNKEGEYNWDRVSTIIGILISLGAFTYLANSIDTRVEDAVINKLNQPDSRLNYHINIKAEAVLASQASTRAIVQVFEGFRGMDNTELKAYLEETMDFSDEMKAALGNIDGVELVETLDWIEEQKEMVQNINTGNNTRAIPKTCGDIIIKGGIPTFFVDENTDLVEIEYGRPDYMRHTTNLCYKYKVYYIETSRGPRVLTSISDIKLVKCD